MTGSSENEIDDTGKPVSKRITLGRVVISAAVVISVTASPFMIFGRPNLSTALTLNEAFVRGAVRHIGTEVDARIIALHVKQGDRVTRGEPLVELSRGEITAERDAATARVARFEADLTQARAAHAILDAREDTAITAAEIELDKTAALLERARARVSLLKKQVARSETLSQDGFASEARLEARLSELAQAQSDMSRYEAVLAARNLAIKRAKISAGAKRARAEERKSMASRLAEARAELAALDLRLDRRTLKTLDDGIVVEIKARVGASVGTNDPILAIWDPDQTWMLAWVEQDQVSRIRVGDPAQVRVDEFDRVIEGRIDRILVAPDGEEQVLPGQPISPLLPGNSRFSVQIGFDAREAIGDILPGMSGSVTIEPTGPQNAGISYAALRRMIFEHF